MKQIIAEAQLHGSIEIAERDLPMHNPMLPQPCRNAEPKTLLRLSGPAARAIQAIAATSPTVARQLVSWTPSYVHGLAMFIQVSGAADRQIAKQLFLSDAKLQKARTVDLLRWAGFDRPEQLVPLLDRLTGRVYQLDQYRKWECLVGDRKVVGYIGSCKTLTQRKLDALVQLPSELRSDRVMQRIRSTTDVAALTLIIDAISRVCPGVPVEDVRRSLRETSAEFDDWLKGWFCKADLPAPPFPGNDLLVPLQTGAQVRETGRAFRNCLTHYLEEAIAGRIVFYVWNGKEPALVAVRPLGQLGWIADGIKGPDNKEPSLGTKRLIVRQLSEWGCCPDHNIQHTLRKWGAWGLL